MLRTLSFFSAVLAMGCCFPASAAIHRCVGPGGTDVFTDRACATLSLETRDPSDARTQLGAWDNVPGRTGARGLVAGCPAATGDALLAAFETGLARRDVNYLAGLFLWNAPGVAQRRETTATLRWLLDRELVELRLLPDSASGFEFADAPAGWDPYLDDPPAPPVATGLVVRHLTRGGEYGHDEETRFAIRESAECLWLELK